MKVFRWNNWRSKLDFAFYRVLSCQRARDPFSHTAQTFPSSIIFLYRVAVPSPRAKNIDRFNCNKSRRLQLHQNSDFSQQPKSSYPRSQRPHTIILLGVCMPGWKFDTASVITASLCICMHAWVIIPFAFSVFIYMHMYTARSGGRRREMRVCFEIAPPAAPLQSAHNSRRRQLKQCSADRWAV